jgi:pyridoxine 5-phosphate synthase
MINLSVNINKIATIRNARGGNMPNLAKFAMDCEKFGADGITVHPRPDERHITLKDVHDIAENIQTEFNIEGYPDERYMKIIKDIRPQQATLVPDPPNVLTSDNGWDFQKDKEKLIPIIQSIKDLGVRTSLFVNADEKSIRAASETGTDRIELYTGPFAEHFHQNPNEAIHSYIQAANIAKECGISVNAGHDLNLDNLQYFAENVTHLDEVSIGHALISDALYFGIENAIQMYKRCLMNHF